MELKATHGFQEVFDHARAEKKRVTVHLSTGASMNGYVGSAGNHHIVLKALSQRDFFDAMIDLGQIAAVEVQTRTA